MSTDFIKIKTVYEDTFGTVDTYEAIVDNKSIGIVFYWAQRAHYVFRPDRSEQVFDTYTLGDIYAFIGSLNRQHMTFQNEANSPGNMWWRKVERKKPKRGPIRYTQTDKRYVQWLGIHWHVSCHKKKWGQLKRLTNDGPYVFQFKYQGNIQTDNVRFSTGILNSLITHLERINNEQPRKLVR